MSLDVLVAGAGPVGLATAIDAALAGLDVAVVEPRSGPIDKACGEGLMPRGVAALARLGVVPTGVPFEGIAYVADGVRAEARFPAAAGLGVRRTVLQAALAQRAAALGVPVLPGRVGEVRQHDDGVTAAGLRARWLVAADGLHSPVRRSLGLDVPVRAARRYGLRRHVAVPPWTTLVEVHWSAGCEVYVTPVGEQLVGVAVLTASRAPYDAWLDAVPALRARLDGAPVASELRGAGPLRVRSSRRVAGRVLLVGDAAGYRDALTGEGLSVGFAGAHAAVEALRRGEPLGYERAWRRLVRRPDLVTAAVLATSRHPAARARLVPAARRAPAVFSAAVRLLA